MLRQIESPHQKDRHLIARHIAIRAVEANSTSASDTLGCQLFDPCNH